MDNVLPTHIHGRIFQILLQRLAGDRQAIRMQQTAGEQHLHERLDAPDRHQLRHQVPATRAQVRQHRDALADAREVVEVQPHAGLMRHREQVQHGVG